MKHETKQPQGADAVIPKGLGKPPVDERRVKIPDPEVPAVVKVEKKVAEKKVAEPAQKPDVQVSSAHLVKQLAKDTDAAKLYRISQLAQTDRDVKWLLEKFNAIQKQNIKK